MVARSYDKLMALAEEIAAFGVEAYPFKLDLAETEQVDKQLARLIAQVGPVDVLVNNAGIGYTGSLGDMPLSDWQQVMNINLTATFQVIKAVLPGMRNQRRGLIINVASIAAEQAFPDWGAYGVSKAAVVALGRAIAAEEAVNGIRVTTLSPGAVDTPLWDSETVDADLNRAAMLSPDTIAQAIAYSARLPPEAVISQLTITPSQGAL